MSLSYGWCAKIFKAHTEKKTEGKRREQRDCAKNREEKSELCFIVASHLFGAFVKTILYGHCWNSLLGKQENKYWHVVSLSIFSWHSAWVFRTQGSKKKKEKAIPHENTFHSSKKSYFTFKAPKKKYFICSIEEKIEKKIMIFVSDFACFALTLATMIQTPCALDKRFESNTKQGQHFLASILCYSFDCWMNETVQKCLGHCSKPYMALILSTNYSFHHMNTSFTQPRES